jgi:hypothetical protein
MRLDEVMLIRQVYTIMQVPADLKDVTVETKTWLVHTAAHHTGS